MKKNYTIKLLLVVLFFNTQIFSQVNVTIRVDMSNETVSENGVHLVGSLNGWSTDATQLTQESNTNIYSTVVQLNSGWQEYKFLNGNAWGTEEQATYPCAPSNGNRFIYINDSGNDVTLETVPFNGCNPEGTGFSVTLNVDMSNESSISADGIYMAGEFNGWSPDNFNLSDVNENIYSTTLRLPTPADYPITFEYKFLNGQGWGNEETPDSNCGTVANNNRIETILSSEQNIYNVFNGCNYTLNSKNTLIENIKVFYAKRQGIKITTQEIFTKLTVEVFDISGRQIIKTSFNDVQNNEYLINVTSLNQGIYLVRFKSDGNESSKKIIIN